MRLALIYPPTCDPTAPYLSVPMLTGFLRSRGVEVVPIDANVEAYDRLLRREPLLAIRDRVEQRIERLNSKKSLSHTEQRAYAALWSARGDAQAVPALIERAVATMRSREEFYDRERYDWAVQVIESALRAISAAHSPLELSFTAYRTPFSLLTPDEIEADAERERDPFYETELDLVGRLRTAKVGLIGLSVVFPGQMQPAFSLAYRLRAGLEDSVHLTIGGPAITQLLVRIQNDAERLGRVLGPFDSAICYEGETALARLVEAVDAKRARADIPNVPNLIVRGRTLTPGGTMEDLRTLPAPDFDGLPLDRYFSPELVLPYDPTRGCYWGVCTFCHYGLAEKGTAPYKERSVETVLEHLDALSRRHATRYFYFSQDSVAPKTLLRLAQGIAARSLDVRWATDLKPERYLTAERAHELRRGGAVGCALGVESAAPRVLALIDKGAPIEVVRDVISHLHGAGIATEAMCFTDFPTESYTEAMATVRFLGELHDHISLFILGEFDLTPGSIVAQKPGAFGLAETWRVAGDELGIGLFYRETRAPKRAHEQERIDRAIAQLATRWQLRRYPWAGSLSTAHTILYYDRFGPDAFQTRSAPSAVRGAIQVADARFDVEVAQVHSDRAERAIWQELVFVRRQVSRAAYRALANAQPRLAATSQRYRYRMGASPEPDGRRPRHQVRPGDVRRPTW